MAVGQIVKSFTKYATPLGVGADLAQAGLEWTGHKEVGKAVGVTGNIASGALMGAPFGPPGAALGALGGFVMWGAGEVIGGLVERAFGDKEEQHDECGSENHHDETGDIEEEQHITDNEPAGDEESEPRESDKEQQQQQTQPGNTEEL